MSLHPRSIGRMSMGRRIQPRAESSKCTTVSAQWWYSSDNISRFDCRTDSEETTGATYDGTRIASTAEGNSVDRQSDGTTRQRSHTTRSEALWSNNVLSIALGEVLHPPLVHGEQSM